MTAQTVRVQEVRKASAEEWDRAYSGDPSATFFHSRAWAALWEAAAGLEASPRFVRFSDGRAAVIPLLLRRKLGGLVRQALSSHAETFGGWVSADGLEPAHARELADLLTGGFGSVRWKLNPFDPLTEPFHARATAPDVTQVLDLDEDFDVLFKRWSKGHKAAVTQARKGGVTVRPADSLEDWRTYYDMYVESYERWGERAFFRYGWEVFEHLARDESGCVRLWLAEHEGRGVAGHVFLESARHVADWHGAARSDGFALRPMNLLIHDVVRDAQARGRRWFDLGSSGPLEGVYRFKKSFGARPLPCPTIEVERGLLRLVRGARRRLSGARAAGEAAKG